MSTISVTYSRMKQFLDSLTGNLWYLNVYLVDRGEVTELLLYDYKILREVF